MTWSPRNRSEDGSDSIDGHGDGDGDSDKEDHNDTSSNLGNADDMDRLGVDRGLLSPGELSLIFSLLLLFVCLFCCSVLRVPFLVIVYMRFLP